MDRSQRVGRVLTAVGCAAVLAAGAVLSACAGHGGAGTAGPVRTQKDQRSAWQTVLDRIGPAGEVDQQTAVQAFGLAVAPLPGVQLPSGRSSTIRSATAAIRWLAAYRSQLSPAQQEAFSTWLASVSRRGSVVRPAGLHEAPTPQPPQADPSVSAAVASAITLIGQKLGRQLTLPVEVEPWEKQKSGDTSLAGNLPLDASDQLIGPAVKCVLLYRPDLPKMSRNVLLETVYHEVFHCFAAAIFPNVATNKKAHTGFSWVLEGGAEWVGDSLAGSDEGEPDYWKTYLTTPGRSLFARVYDAIGFFSHLAESGVDVWKVLDPMVKAVIGGTNTTVLQVALAAGNASQVLDTWASGYARGRHPGQAWDTTGPGITADRPDVSTTAVGNGANSTVSAPVAGNALRILDLRADVVRFAATGDAHGRLGPVSGADIVLADLVAGDWCTKPGGCRCPDGTAGAGAELPTLPAGTAWLAVTGGATGGASVTVTGTALDQACKQRPKPNACLVGTWVSSGVVLDSDRADFAGGAGVRLTISADDMAATDFSGMSPIQGTITSPGGSLPVSFKYSGQTRAKLVAKPDGTYQTENATGGVKATGSIGGMVPFDMDFPAGGGAPKGAPAAGGSSMNGLGQATMIGPTLVCTPTTLTSSGAIAGYQVRWTFNRSR